MGAKRAAKLCRVYPRACGGTAVTQIAPTETVGLSPRVRGNPGHAVVGQRRDGSIPARAGEPGGGWDHAQ